MQISNRMRMLSKSGMTLSVILGKSMTRNTLILFLGFKRTSCTLTTKTLFVTS